MVDAGTCYACLESLVGKVRTAGGQKYHAHCLLCSDCRTPIEGKIVMSAPTHGSPEPMHPECLARLKGDVCDTCSEPIVGGADIILVMGRKFHADCLICGRCGGIIDSEVAVHGAKPAHKVCPPNPRKPAKRRPSGTTTSGGDTATATAAFLRAYTNGPSRTPPPGELDAELFGADGALRPRARSMDQGSADACVAAVGQAVTILKARLQDSVNPWLHSMLPLASRLMKAATVAERLHQHSCIVAANQLTRKVEESDEVTAKSVTSLFNARSNAASLGRDMVTLQREVEAKVRTGTGPCGSVALIFTDVQGSTRLWDTMNNTMRAALDIHHALFRRLILQYEGFEVKTEGDAFMVAFGDPVAAARFCIEAQRELMKADWPPDLLSDHDAADEEHDGVRIFRGLRVRMGGELGKPSDQRDPVTGRTDYYGPDVNLAARVCGSAVGGQILFGPALAAAAVADPRFRKEAVVHDAGPHTFKGIGREVNVTEVFPAAYGEPRAAYLRAIKARKETVAQGTLEANTKPEVSTLDVAALAKVHEKVSAGLLAVERKYVAQLDENARMADIVASLEGELQALKQTAAYIDSQPSQNRAAPMSGANVISSFSTIAGDASEDMTDSYGPSLLLGQLSKGIQGTRGAIGPPRKASPRAEVAASNVSPLPVLGPRVGSAARR